MFDFEKYASQVIAFFTGNIFIAIGAVVILVVLFYKKPGETIKFLGFCFLIVAVLYIMSLLTESGSQGVLQKKGVTTKSEKELLEQ